MVAQPLLVPVVLVLVIRQGGPVGGRLASLVLQQFLGQWLGRREPVPIERSFVPLCRRSKHRRSLLSVRLLLSSSCFAFSTAAKRCAEVGRDDVGTDP